MENDKFIVYPPKLRLFLLLLGAIAFVLIAFVIILSGSFYFKIIGLAGLIFFGYAAINALVRLFSFSPVLIVDNKGITDKSAAFTFGFLSWDQIEKIYLTVFMGKKMLAVMPKSYNEYLAKSGSIKASLYKMNLNFIKAPFAIAEQNLSVSLERVVAEINKHFTVSSFFGDISEGHKEEK